MSRDSTFLKGVLFVILFTCVLLGFDFYNKNTEQVLSFFGKETLFMSNALTLEEFRETQGWGIDNLHLIEDQTGIMFTITNNGKDVYTPNRYWYSSIGVKTYAMKLSLRAQLIANPLAYYLQPQGPILYPWEKIE